MRRSTKGRAVRAQYVIGMVGVAVLLAGSFFALGRSSAQQQQHRRKDSTLQQSTADELQQRQQDPDAAASALAIETHDGALSGWVTGYEARVATLSKHAKASKDGQLEHLIRLLIDGKLLGQSGTVRRARRLYARALAQLQATSGAVLPHNLIPPEGGTENSSSISGSSGRGTESAALAQFVSHAFSLLANRGPGQPSIVPCSHDAALPLALQRQAQQKQQGQQRVLIAVTLKDSAHLMPNFIAQLLQLLLWLPPSSAMVSVYESGSTDETPAWLRLLQLMLEPIGVRANITASGSLIRGKDEERIQYLAAVRNAVLSPSFSERARQRCSSDTRISGRAGSESSRGGDDSGCFEPDSVLFINDVYWCADAAARLLLHEADVACGLDYGRVETEEAVKAAGHGCCYRRRGRRLAAVKQRQKERQLQQEQQQQWQRDKQHPDQQQQQQEQQQQQQEFGLSGPKRQLQGVKMVSYQDILDHSQEPHFGLHSFPMYDTWVVRDITGMRLRWRRPYGHSQATNQQLAAGLPFPAYACWGGMAKVAAEPFRRGLRFRTHVDGECRASECSLLCDDMHRMGFGRVLIDPYVRTAYDYQTAYAAHVDGGSHFSALTGIRLSSWREQAVQRGVDWSAASSRPAYGSVDCCGKEPESNAVKFEACRPLDVMHKNHTRAFFEQCGQQGSDGSSSSGPSRRHTYITGHTQHPDGVWDKVSRAPCPEL